MIAAFAFNSTIVAALILIPLLNPQVLPRQMITYLGSQIISRINTALP
jgi:hypothetical protein